uniref:Uncharacterized protein n=1 Tax=Anopheles dirus TaxID=7168 RepID=A0A182NYE3_9DIPT
SIVAHTAHALDHGRHSLSPGIRSCGCGWDENCALQPCSITCVMCCVAFAATAPNAPQRVQPRVRR